MAILAIAALAAMAFAAPADTTPPNTSIASGPAAGTSSTSASFSFKATEPGARFECKRDGGSYRSCTSPKSYSGIGTGLHRFSVRARDASGNVDPTAAVRSWTVVAVDRWSA
jgi:hypothetical protein